MIYIALPLLWAAFTAAAVFRTARRSARDGSRVGCGLTLAIGVLAPLIAFMWRDSVPAWAWWASAFAAVTGGLAAIPQFIDATDQRTAWLREYELVDADVFFSGVRYTDGLPAVGPGYGDVRVKEDQLYITAFTAATPKSRSPTNLAPPPTAIPLVRVEGVNAANGDVWGFPLIVRWKTVDGVPRKRRFHNRWR